jgi:hypothetical protein
LLTPNKLDHDTFYTIFSLIRQQEWLSGKSKAVIELYNLCETDLQQNLIVDLLTRFKYLNSSSVNNNGIKITDKVITEWKCNAENCLMIAIADTQEGKIDGSQGLLNSLKEKFADFDFTNDNFISSIGKGAHKIKSNQTAILFDDFIGSGETIDRKIRWFIDKLKNLKKSNVTIKVVCYGLMRYAIETFKNNNVDFYSPEILDKGISDYYPEHLRELYLEEMLKLEEKLETVSKNIHLSAYSLGYKKSEAIYKLEAFNVSDNVFPIFWWPEVKEKLKRSTLFNRLN